MWWTTQWTTDTISFKDSFALSQWAVNRVSTAVLKVTADDKMRVLFNGVVLENYVASQGWKAFKSYSIKAQLKGSSSILYQENLLEVTVKSDGNFEGLVYLIELEFT